MMSVHTQARRVVRLLHERNMKVVFAESCTGGGASAALTKFPGVSAFHCGAMVVYRNETKTAFLGIDPQLLKRPGPVSRQVAQQMAIRVLEKTPEADLAAAVTGHLGPDAPARLDGVAYIAVAQRGANGRQSRPTVSVRRYCCDSNTRGSRQTEVIQAVLQSLAEALAERMKK